MPRRNILILIVVVLVAVLCRARVPNPYVRVLGNAMARIDNIALEPVGEQALFEGAMDGMLSQFDDNSRYFSPAEFKSFNEEVDLEFGGIGIDLIIDPKTKEPIVSPAMSSPAARAGVLTGDRIVQINKAGTQGMSSGDIAALLRGKPGTSVTLTVLHAGDDKPQEITIVRETVQGDSVRGDTRNPDGSWEFFLAGHDRIGYVRITDSFSENTVNELRQALAWATQQGMRGLVLDLRDNPGGHLGAGIGVCDLLVKSGKIVTTRWRKGEETFIASGNAPFTDFPIAVLVDDNTASAAEIVAACLQDNKRATVFGQRSYGKGTVQEVIALEEGCGGMKLTTKGFWRPSGDNIQRPHDASAKGVWGVSPDKGCKIEWTEEERKKWREWRQERDVHHAPGDGKPFVDRQRALAVEFIEKEATKRESRKPGKP
jgi:carboxyl-terminal processing protease